MIEANHCPGAVMILFKGNKGIVLHTGDFRYNENMVKTFDGIKLDVLYLDNTFTSAVDDFPS
jgi:DNA cross-link repair 1B protein